MFISESIKYIGVDDKTIDLFEGQYIVENGMAYNSYLIMDEKVALMDTVDERGLEEWSRNLEEALEGRNVDYIVVQHMEPDHSGSLAYALEKYPEAVVVGNAKTFVYFNQFFDIDISNRKLEVKEGDTLSLGNHLLTFVMAPMVHWPEVMVTYESTEKVLFSADEGQTAARFSAPRPAGGSVPAQPFQAVSRRMDCPSFGSFFMVMAHKVSVFDLTLPSAVRKKAFL